MSTCNLDVPAPITITVVPELEEQCLGVYHCGEGRIEMLPPDAYADLRNRTGASAFAAVSADAFFESVLRHELAHAALDTMPCPFKSCITGQEYVAYTMQVRFLPEDDIRAFEAASSDSYRVTRDALSPMILGMAPDLFAQRAWQHLSQRDDACAFIGQIARGQVLLDRERH